MLRGCSTVSLVLLASFTLASSLDSTCFANSGATVALPSDPSWQTSKAIFNLKIQKEPAAIVYAEDQAQVQAAVKCARSSGLQVVPRAGGHAYEGYSVQDGSLVIDVSKLMDFQVSPDKSTVTFGAGYRLGRLALDLQMRANAFIPIGTCPWVGAAGLILGGGLGMSIRTHGLACDHLVGLSMVDNQGNIIQASKTENQDLLWASCGGGGGNLGIVTSFTVKPISFSNATTVTTVVLKWPGYNSTVQLFDKVQRYFATADRRMSASLLIGKGSSEMQLQWFGDKDSFNTELQNSGILDIPVYSFEESDPRQGSLTDAALRWGMRTMRIDGNSIYNLNMTSVPAAGETAFTAGSTYNQELMSIEGIQTMVESVVNLPAEQGGFGVFAEHTFMGGAVSDVAPTDAAFYWRNSLYNTQWFYYWSGTDRSEQSKTWLRETTAAMRQYVGQGAYINYVDPVLAASSEWPETYYGGNLERYESVKAKYDSSNYFYNPLTVTSGISSNASRVPPDAQTATAG